MRTNLNPTNKRIYAWRLCFFAAVTLLISFLNSIHGITPKASFSEIASLEVHIKDLQKGNEHSKLAHTYIQKSKLEASILLDTSESFYSLRKAIENAKQTNNINLEFYCLYKLRFAQYSSNITFQRITALDTVLMSMLDMNSIEDSLRFSAHQLWGDIYVKHNYNILALNEYLLSQNIAYSLNDDTKIVTNLIQLLLIYDILKDDKSFFETRASIEHYLPTVNTELQVRYYLRLCSFKSKFETKEIDSYLKKATRLSKGSKKLDFRLKKELTIYYIIHGMPDSAIATIKYLENKYLSQKPLGHFYAPIHIEELYARYFYVKGEYTKAEVHFAKALAICDEMNAPFLKRQLLILVLNISDELADYKLAFEALKMLKLLEDSTVNRSQLLEYQKLKNQLYNEQISKKINALEYNEKISELEIKNKNKNILWLSSAAVALLAILLIFLIRYQQKKVSSKELQSLIELKDFIFSVISHDLRSPLYNFNSLLHMAENKYIKEEEYSNYLKIIQTELKGITGVTESLLRWAKSNQGLLKVDLVTFSLMDLLVEVKDLFKQDLVEHNIHIISNFLYDIQIHSDKEMFSFILRNVIQNAIKFSNDNSQIEINAKNENNFITIEVVDHGVGMDEEKLQNFNERISSPSNDLKGIKSTGLGLIIAKDFAKKLEIEIGAKSDVGKGTTIGLKFYSPIE